MDELGRGTSPQEGLAIALAVVKYLHDDLQCRCLFATHFFECAELAEKLSGAVNYYVDTVVSTQDNTQSLTFKHKIKPGYVTQSHGIFIAKISNFPTKVIDTASNHFLQYLKSKQNVVSS
ncbi:MutS domain III family protein [Reticulomyxa filosa]|uniref:MutS domain III family protein n=1 Tax=Reticulomyxa filosa TaxID=46433 RepID=X6P0N0_RETFI|nr:MutS domain III family protein [Reticulomyxa filosa]|eukprot:ETO32120.1 MutS domain III family protein [Reticulomyxa filosa]